MKRRLERVWSGVAGAVLLALCGAPSAVALETPRPLGATSDTIQVAPPTGEQESDRSVISAALEHAGPGETVQFAPGTSLVGEVIRVETPRITLLGHPEGTVLRGCDPDEYEASEREVMSTQGVASGDVAARCGMFELSGGEVTVRGLTFEYSRLGLLLGCCTIERRFSPTRR